MAEEGAEACPQSGGAGLPSLCDRAELECNDSEQFLSALETFEAEQDQLDA